MTQEEKDLVVKDLCGRLPYGVKVHFGSEPWTLTGLFKSEHAGVMVILLPRFPAANAYPNTSNWPLEKVKPYLRPLSSMTDEEKYQYEETQWEYQADYCAPEYFDGLESYDWLNAHFFDFRGLIEKGLALEAPEGMYFT